MEITENMLRKIVKHLVDLSIRIDAMESILIQQLGGNPQHLDAMLKKAHEALDYQLICDRVFRELQVYP